MQPPGLVRRAVIKGFPETAAAWLAGFPSFMDGLLDRWQLVVEGQADSGWPTNQVHFVRDQAGTPYALKVGHPSPGSETERLTLLEFRDKNIAVVALKDYVEGYALLVERIEPGLKLRQRIREPEAIRAALQLHVDFPQAALAGMPTYANWLSKAFGEYRAQPNQSGEFLRFIEKAEQFFAEMCTSENCLLHGDLHHENILLGKDGWVVIDPKGVVGPRAMECGRFFHNFVRDEIDGPITQGKIVSVLYARFKLGSEVVPFTKEVLAKVTFIDLTLAIAWHLNSPEDGSEGLAVLRALSVML